MGLNDPLADRRLIVYQGGVDDLTAYPATHLGWVNRYQYLLDAYHGETYTQHQCKELNLFRALDDDGKIIALTRRLHRDIQYIVDTGRQALALGQLTLHRTEGTTDAEYQSALDIWARSMPASQGSVWSLLLCCTGDLYLEAARVTPGSMAVSLLSYSPDKVYTEYDIAAGIRMVRAIVTSDIMGEAQVDVDGNVTEAAALYRHQRTLTSETITVEAELPRTVEGDTQRELDRAASGPHGLGVVPLTHIRCIPTVYPEHSLPVTHGIDRGLAEVDSMASQISAVADRFGNPKPYLFGAKIGDSSALGRFGRWINAWGNNSDKISAGYLEPSMDGVTRLQEALERMIRDIRLTFPEFLFVGGGSTANLSGEALRLLQSRYESKYLDIRARMYAGLERALAIGVALEQRREYDPTRHPVRISAPPLLPADKKAELEALTLARGLGAISPVDLVRHLQRLGLASDDVPADDYLSDLMSPDERTGLDSGHVALMAEVVSDLDDAEQLLERISEQLPAELADDVASVVEAISDASSTLQADIPDYDETDDA
jgi:hypothetical protein